MNIFVAPHLEILEALLKAKVNFMLVGGYAVIFHGYRRTTGDMDLWLKPDNQNKLRFAEALKDIMETDVVTIVKELDFEETHVFTIGEEPYKVDFLTKIAEVKYEDAEIGKVMANIDGLSIPVIHLNDLVMSKMSSDRLKDKLDVEELQKIKGRK